MKEHAMKRFLPTLGLCAALAGPLAGAAAAQTSFYGVTYFGDQLIRVDAATGVGTLIGALAPGITPDGLAFSNNGLYTFDIASSKVVRIDPATGGTVASYSVGLGPALGQGGLAFNGAGVGFLTTALDPATLAPVNDLFSFNLSTGTSTLVAHTADTLSGLAFSPGGTLYGLGKGDGELYTINPTTGATTLVGALTLSDGTPIGTGSPVGALGFGRDGTLYAVAEDSLFTVNPTTAAATQAGPADPLTQDNSAIGFSSISGIAPAAVPEPSSLVLLGLGLAGAVVVGLRRRHARAG